MSTYQPLAESFYNTTNLNALQAVRKPSPDDYRAARNRVNRSAPDLMGIIFGDAA